MEIKISYKLRYYCLFFGITFSQISPYANSEQFKWNGQNYKLSDESTGNGRSFSKLVDTSLPPQCQTNNVGCCAMYTFPGNGALDDKNTAPQTCSQLEYIKDDPKNHVACFGPLIYSNGSRRPDPSLVNDICMAKNLPCFCTSKTCIKYTYILNNKNKTIVNETRFCGSLTNVETHSPVTSGCFTETIKGSPYLREVCACEADNIHYCNSTTGVEFLSSFSLVSFLIMSLFSYAVHFC